MCVFVCVFRHACERMHRAEGGIISTGPGVPGNSESSNREKKKQNFSSSATSIQSLHKIPG